MKKDFLIGGGVLKKLKASELFSLKSNPQLNKDSFVFSKSSTYPYFTRTVFNNGIMGYVDYLDEEHKIRGNCLSVGMIGMKFFYMANDFYAGQFTKSIHPKFDGFNENIALWFVSWFNKSSDRFLSVLVRDFESLFNETEIEVPYKNGVICLSYINSVVDIIKQTELFKLKNFYDSNGLSDCSLTEGEIDAITTMNTHTLTKNNYSLESIFTLKGVKQSKGQSEIPTDVNGIPYIVQSMSNNMCSRNVKRQWLIDNNEPPQKGNAIVLGVTLPAVSYQPFEFGASQIITARNPNLNENIGLYYAAVLSKHMQKFSYQNKPGIQKYKELLLNLPINNNGSIDYAFMDTYINAIKKQCISRLKSSDIFNTCSDKTLNNIVVSSDNVSSSDRYTKYLPVYPFRIACGAFESGEAVLEDEIKGWVDVSMQGVKPNEQMFIVEAKGESMCPDINPGDLCIFEKYTSSNAGSRDDKIVLAKCSGKDDDYNCEYTIKRYHSEKIQDGDSWRHSKIELQPLNKNGYSSIILNAEDNVQIIGILKAVIAK